MRVLFQRAILGRPVLAFAVMGLGFLAFGVSSLNLVYVLRANASFLLENGWMAIVDGGLWQLLQLLLNAYVAMAAYVVFKSCEYALVHWASDAMAPVAAAATATESG